jgi:hypothetical protein
LKTGVGNDAHREPQVLGTLAPVNSPMFVYGLLRFEHLSPGGDHHRIIPSHWIATTGLGPPLHGIEVYHPEPVAFFAVHRLDFIKPR